ncbi:MAG: glycosyltransferase family 39 protein [Deltaproteobacteria bacterium]|nr:glycosyltransferase family 39 protein [Deltaproteobacteria bacterium]
MRRHFLHITLLVCVVAAIFHRLMLAEISVVDDMVLLKGMLESERFDLGGLFFPGGGAGVYYRPMTGLSFWIESLLWSLRPSMLHLVNILFHLANVLLLYVMSIRILPDDMRKGYAPLAAALLFAFHPLVNESVAWISGRTDLLATVFVLLSTLAVQRCRETGRSRYLAVAAVALIPGVLAKETALAFPLAAAWLLSDRREGAHSPAGATNPSRQAGRFLRRAAWGAAATLAFLLGVFLLRKQAFTADDNRIDKALGLIVDSPGAILADMLSAFGFYLKKFLLPLPLSFTITAISPWYLAVGIGVVLGCMWCALRRDLPAVLFLAGCCMILPALLLTNGAVAWTPYAERYCYPALPFWVMAAVMRGSRLIRQMRISDRAAHATVITVIVVSAVITWERNGLWLTNEALMADTVDKAPMFARVRQYYMLALAAKGDTAGAKRQENISLAMDGSRYVPEQDLDLAEDLVRRGLHKKVFDFVESKLRAEFGDTPRLYTTMRLFYRELYERTRDEQVRARIIPYEALRDSVRTDMPLMPIFSLRSSAS